MGQLPLFSEPITEPSTSVIGLQVTLPGPCRCGESVAVTRSSRGPHHAGLLCDCCGGHRGWLSGATFRFLSDVIENFGRPIEPIEIRQPHPRVSADNSQ
jgi:hypothetical protein